MKKTFGKNSYIMILLNNSEDIIKHNIFHNLGTNIFLLNTFRKA